MTPTGSSHAARTAAKAATVAGIVAFALAACTASGTSSPPAPSAAAPAASPSPSGIVREELGAAAPETAPGQELGLWRYTIPAGSQLVPHEHPGWQVARIDSGTLTYSIIAGDVSVTRANGTVETHAGGETIELAPGDTVVENPGTQHFGANEGTEAVVLYTSTLFDQDEPPSIPLATPTPSPS